MKGFVGSGLQLKAADICKFGIYQSLNCAVIEKRQGFVYQKISSKENIPSRIICVRNIEFYVIYIIRFHVPIFIQSGIFMIIQVVLFKQLLISQQFCIIDLHTITVRVLIRRNKIVVANWNKITRLINFVRDLIRKMIGKKPPSRRPNRRDTQELTTQRWCFSVLSESFFP